MSRTEKQYEHITASELISIRAELSIALEVIGDAMEECDENGIAMHYRDSLRRGIKSVRTGTESMRRSIALIRAGARPEVEASIEDQVDKAAKKGAARKRKSNAKRSRHSS